MRGLCLACLLLVLSACAEDNGGKALDAASVAGAAWSVVNVVVGVY